jgi:hypothetical protein
MNTATVATIPGGVWRDGRRNREVHFRELSAGDQLALMNSARDTLPAAWATDLLSRCVQSLGGEEHVSRDAVRNLCVGDREALLLEFRRRFIGNSLQCTLSCPLPECGQKLDLELHVTDLLVPPYPEWPDKQEARIEEGGVSYVVRFRPPSGVDQEYVAALAVSDPRRAAALLLARCIESVERADGSEACEWPLAIRRHLPSAMAHLDTQAELRLQVRCTVCGRDFSTELDVATFLKRELPDHFRRVFAEVHQLAYHYHWSATEILEMPPDARSFYLQMLEEQLASGAPR